MSTTRQPSTPAVTTAMARLRRWVRSRVHGARERGSAGLVVVALMLPMLMGAGLIWDASGKIRAARTADTAAQEAARAAAQQLSASTINGDAAAADPGPAVAAAQAYLAAAGISGSAVVAGDLVTVTTSTSWTPQFLPGGGGAVTGSATIRIAREQ